MSTRMQAWEKTMRANVRKLTPEQAREIIAKVHARGVTIHHPELAELTGGLNSQNINFNAMRALAVLAGIIKGK